MKTLAARRWWNLSLLLAAVLAVLAASVFYAASLRPYAFVSGWLLFAAIVLLAGYNVRKRLPMLPLGSSSTWLQLHIYAGLFTAFAFAVHVDYSLPGGVLDVALALVYAAVFASGVAGLVMSRVFPARLTTYGREVPYSRIPVHRRRLQDEVEDLIINCLEETGSGAVAEFYERELKRFFDAPRDFWLHVVHSRRPRRRTSLALDSQRRYLNSRENEVLSVLGDRVSAKHDLDQQYALQSALKLWLFAHVPLTYALLILSLLHLVLVHAFSGAAA